MRPTATRRPPRAPPRLRRRPAHPVAAAPAPPRPSPVPNERDDGGGAPPQLSEAAILLAACGVGVATGAAVVAFNDAIALVRDAAWAGAPLEATHWGRWARSLPLATAAPLLLLPPTLAGAAVGALRAAAGGSLDDPPPGSGASAGAKVRAPVLRAAAAALTLGGGASLGPEGPAVDIGRSTARGAAALLAGGGGAVPLLAAGAGAGVAAGFGAPIAGVFFAVETVLRPGARVGPTPDADADDVTTSSPGLTIAAVLLAAVLAAVVSQAGLGGTPAVRVPTFAPLSPAELPLALALGALCGAVAAVWRRTEAAAAAVADAAERAGVPAAALPALAGAATGVVALAWPEVLYQGLGNVNAVLAAGVDGGGGGGGGVVETAYAYGPALLAQIAAAKVVATSICRGGRLVGGLYAPSILVGAALGGAFGGLVSGDLSDLGAPPAYALVGAASVLAAECGVPLTAALLVFELTRDYVVVIPALGAAGVAAWVGGGGLLPRGRASPAPGGVGAVLADAAAAAAAASDAPRSSVDGGAEERRGGGAGAGAAPSPPTPPSALCAADAACVVLPADTPLTDALDVLESEGRDDAAAVLLSADGGVAGVLTLAAARRAAAAGGGTAGEARQREALIEE